MGGKWPRSRSPGITNNYYYVLHYVFLAFPARYLFYTAYFCFPCIFIYLAVTLHDIPVSVFNLKHQQTRLQSLAALFPTRKRSGIIKNAGHTALRFSLAKRRAAG